MCYFAVVSTQDLKKRKLKVPESEYKDGPEGLKCAPQASPCSCTLLLLPSRT